MLLNNTLTVSSDPDICINSEHVVSVRVKVRVPESGGSVLRSFVLVSVYFPSRAQVGQLDNDLAALAHFIQSHQNEPVILTGDFNARHTRWGDRVHNTIGNQLSEIIDEFDLTFYRTYEPSLVNYNSGTSYIDLTLANTAAMPIISEFVQHAHSDTSSDHSAQSFRVFDSCTARHRQQLTTWKYTESSANWLLFSDKFENHECDSLLDMSRTLDSTLQIDSCISSLTSLIIRTADKALPEKPASTGANPPFASVKPFYWDDELREENKYYRTVKRELNRISHPECAISFANTSSSHVTDLNR